jgi:RNA polymerase sigma-70 factor, ECF subfamily
MAGPTPSEIPDAARLNRLTSVDRDALVLIADRVLRDRHEAEDVVQETILAVWQRLPDIAADKVSHYLYRAVRQNARKRRSRLREHAALEGVIEAVQLDPRSQSVWADPIDLDEAIRSLPNSQQRVIRLKYYVGLNFRQIGVSLSISTHTAASRCRYAIARLRRLLTR